MDDEILICDSAKLSDGGKGVRFPLMLFGRDATGFAVRYGGAVYAYVNRCVHVPVELDWNEGDFFDSSGLYLTCSTHGALYIPESGRCAGGPCRGGRLRPIIVLERNNQVFWKPDEQVRPLTA